MTDDGVALMSAAHPRAPWYKRLWLACCCPKLSLSSLETIEINLGDDMSDEQDIETRLQDLGLNAPRLSPEKIDAVIADCTFTILPSGRTTICELTLKNGFTLRGESSVVSSANFNKAIGEELAYTDAKRKVWQLEAYLLTQQLYEGRVYAKDG